jgi:diketogulonate reductase-like aldo/keto reductase
MKIKLKEWKVGEDDNKMMTIGGYFSIMSGEIEIAKKAFNLGYEHIDIALPSEVIELTEKATALIKQALENTFKE